MNEQHVEEHPKSFWRKWLTKMLLSRLNTGSVETRTYMLQALGKIGDREALPAILDAAEDDNCSIRRFAISALMDIEDRRAIDALIEALADSEADIREAAVIALGRYGGERAENALLSLLCDDDDSVRSQAVIALGHLGSHSALPLLNQMMNTESSEWMRRYITQAIRDIEGGS
jgi:HEAT repeat protein